MIRHFCDICEEALDKDRINRNNIVLVVENIHIAIAINLTDSGEDYKPSICPACLFAQAAIASDSYFERGIFQKAKELPLSTVINLAPHTQTQSSDEASGD